MSKVPQTPKDIFLNMLNSNDSSLTHSKNLLQEISQQTSQATTPARILKQSLAC